MEKRNYEARNVTDGDPGTRWSSIYKDQEWIVVDLGERHEIGGISLQWENAFGRAYDIQVSNDAKQWTTLFRELHSNGGQDDIPVYAEARYVKLAGLGRGTTNGYSLYALMCMSIFKVMKNRSIPFRPCLSRLRYRLGLAVMP